MSKTPIRSSDSRTPKPRVQQAHGNPDPQIGVVESHCRAESLELAFGHVGPDQRRRQIVETYTHTSPPGVAPFDGLIGAWRDGRLVGVIFSQVAPGKTAVVWLPRLVDGEPNATAALLYTATWEFLTRKQVMLAQVMVSTVRQNEAAMLQLGGFCHLADLLYLVSLEAEFPVEIPNMQWNFESYCVAHHNRWTEILTATFEDTHDCADLHDMRSSDDVLAGYRSTGVFDPNLWLIARRQQHVVGCLLVADHPQHENMELLYLGLVPEARGRGWGKRLARQAQWLARRAGRRQLVLAVDAANAPALQTYTSVGFQAWQRRRLFVRPIPSDGIGTLGLNRFSTKAAERQ